jgi:hypothetical protein
MEHGAVQKYGAEHQIWRHRHLCRRNGRSTYVLQIGIPQTTGRENRQHVRCLEVGRRGKKKEKLTQVFCRFVVGPYEEKDYTARSTQASNFYRQQVQNIPNVGSSRQRSGSWHSSSKPKNPVFHVITQALRVYKKIIYKIKCCDRHLACPHPFSCLYYTMQVINVLLWKNAFLIQ